MNWNRETGLKRVLRFSAFLVAGVSLLSMWPCFCEAMEGNTWDDLEAEGWVEISHTDPIAQLGSVPDNNLEMSSAAQSWLADNSGTETMAAEPSPSSGAPQVSQSGGAEGVPGLHHSGPVAPIPTAADTRLELTFTSAWSSKWMWRGYNIFDNPMYANALKAKLWDTGFNLTVANIGTAADRGDSIIGRDLPDWIENALPGFEHRDFDSNLYRADWQGSICEQIDVTFGAQYYDFYKISSSRLDYMEAFGVFTLSKMPLSPHVGFFYGWPYGSASQGEGWMIDYGVSHFHPFQDLSFCNFKLLGMLLKADLWYNGGAWAPFQAPGWSHATFTGAVPVALSEKLSLTPMVNYQYSIEDRVDPDNEWYTAVALQYKW